MNDNENQRSTRAPENDGPSVLLKAEPRPEFGYLHKQPRRFILFRDVDETGISGTGVVAQGVQFRKTGACFMEWVTPNTAPTWGYYRSIFDVKNVHGHNGKTRILWPDDICTAALFMPAAKGDLTFPAATLECGGEPGHTGDHGSPETGIRWGDESRGAIPALKGLVPERQLELRNRERHMYDLYNALGITWGQDPFTAIAKLGGQPIHHGPLP